MSNEPGFFDYVCWNSDKFAMLFALEVFGFLLSLGAMFATAPQTPTHAIASLNVLGAGVLGTGTGLLLYFCHKR
ncbi:hypothetical protein [Haloprofundus marisrubri]|uniref:hypothetical protein n=1 Tax=Haloprofundus marisrubri TaxID=1514971 RepID=UPI0009E41299|nr:hypothetical protein [Haloprofundus marisrubri]